MKVFAATKSGQGQRDNDFCYVPEDELVIFPVFECTHEIVDGKCGCKRCMEGIKGHKSTTTFKVVEVPYSEKEFEDIVFNSYLNAGLKENDPKTSAILHAVNCPTIRDYAKQTAYKIAAMAKYCVPGCILERREQVTFRL